VGFRREEKAISELQGQQPFRQILTAIIASAAASPGAQPRCANQFAFCILQRATGIYTNRNGRVKNCRAAISLAPASLVRLAPLAT
jgi:hypothetical protein